MSKQALRVGDAVQCTCSCKKSKPCPNGRIVSGARSVFVNSRQAAIEGSITTNCCGSCCPCPNSISKGSRTVLFEGKGAARMGDPIRCGFAKEASRDVFIG